MHRHGRNPANVDDPVDAARKRGDRDNCASDQRIFGEPRTDVVEVRNSIACAKRFRQRLQVWDLVRWIGAGRKLTALAGATDRKRERSILSRTPLARRIAAEADILGKIGTLFRIIRRDHGIVGRQSPLGTVFVWSEIVVGAQVALQHLEERPLVLRGALTNHVQQR